MILLGLPIKNLRNLCQLTKLETSIEDVKKLLKSSSADIGRNLGFWVAHFKQKLSLTTIKKEFV